MSEEGTTATATGTDPARPADAGLATGGSPSTGGTPAPLDWSAHIPKELSQEKVWEQFKGKPVDEVLKQVVALNKYNVGAIKLPDEKDPERGKKLGEIYNKMGRPAEAGGYKAEVTWPEGVQLSPEHDQQFRQHAHSLGLSNSQYDGVMKFFAGYVSEGMQAKAAGAGKSEKEGWDALKKEWGVNFGTNKVLAQEGFAQVVRKALGGDGAEATALLDRMNETPLANDPSFIRVLATIGGELAEDVLIKTDEKDLVNKESLERKIMELKADPDYTNDRSPRKPFLVDEVHKLYQRLYNPITQDFR